MKGSLIRLVNPYQNYINNNNVYMSYIDKISEFFYTITNNKQILICLFPETTKINK
jgi:hypothetical protein